MLLLFLACTTPTNSVDPPEAAQALPGPAAPPKAALPVDAQIDQQVRALFAGSDRFDADASGAATRGVQDLGPKALPELLRLVDVATDDRALHSLCSAIGTLDVREPLAAPILMRHLERGDAAVAACGSAAARTLGVGAPEAKELLALTRDGHRKCWVREAVAASFREPSVCAEVLERVTNTGCSGRVAMLAAGSCVGAGPPLARIIENGTPEAQEAALKALLGQEHLDATLLDTLRERLKNGPLNNAAALCLKLMGKHGSAADKALLLGVVKRDSAGGGYHARLAKQAVKQIETR